MDSLIRFGGTFAAWILAFFPLLRTSLVEKGMLLPLAQFQGLVAAWHAGATAVPVQVTLSCSAGDEMALCVAATLAYPAPWRRRIQAAAGGIALILALNTIRIAILGRAAGTPAFTVLHVYVWPAVLVAATLIYVATWMSKAGRPDRARPGVAWRFAWLAMLLVGGFVALAPIVLQSAPALTACTGVARAVASLLRVAGVQAIATGTTLAIGDRLWTITPDCITTPLMPVYVAAACTIPAAWATRVWALAIVVPLFTALAIARLLTLALPAALVESPLAATHAFYQVGLGAAVVAVAAWQAGRDRVLMRTALAVLLGIGLALVAGNASLSLVVSALASLQPLAGHASAALDAHADAQRALAMLPAFQFTLFIALWVTAAGASGWRRAWAGVLLLVMSQVALAALLGELVAHVNLAVPVVPLRGWALASPILVVWLLVPSPSPSVERESAYRRFWTTVGERFPDLWGAASTTYYRRNEQRLLRGATRSLAAGRVLKTDLWDEAKNTRILQWIDRQGARVFGVDLSEPTVRGAAAEFGRGCLRAAVADVRLLPFAPDSFDVVYSMGTVEHFAGTEQALTEIQRVLRPGGRAIVGVPNRWDPFLRPLMVAALRRAGLYAYGFEKSYSRRGLRRLMERAGFETIAETGILFIPGWLRMLDLAFHVYAPSLSRMSAPAVRLFAWLDAHIPVLRRHGYLIVVVATKR
ncbi:MAG: methyltransferase domain-containing protein [Vicinamibacterales bacterium]